MPSEILILIIFLLSPGLCYKLFSLATNLFLLKITISSLFKRPHSLYNLWNIKKLLINIQSYTDLSFNLIFFTHVGVSDWLHFKDYNCFISVSVYECTSRPDQPPPPRRTPRRGAGKWIRTKYNGVYVWKCCN